LIELEHFVNAGYGWTCKRCAEESATQARVEGARARFFSEGEAEEREPALSAQALARWRDASRRTLVCPRCHVEEHLDG
jgi:formate-dependent nitrite reductase cytochrome c552 subunit